MARLQLPSVIAKLEQLHGRPAPPELTDPFELILWENVAYLANDEKRKLAFDALRDQVGLTAEKILAASDETLREVTGFAGILPDTQLAKVRKIAEIALDDGHPTDALKQPLATAMRALKKYPGIGDPGAEKILLFSGTAPIFALESNGLRVLLRLGFGTENKNYAASYHSAQAAVKAQLPDDTAWLIRAHQLLRRHGMEICRRNRPACDACPLADGCRFCLSDRQ